MPSSKRRGPVPRRRRHDDDGEEDGSVAGDLQEYASSEGSVNTDVEEDGDVSAASVDEEAQSTPSPVLEKHQPPQRADQDAHFKTTAETEAMLHGLRIRDGEAVEEVNFDDFANTQDRARPPQTQSTIRPQSKPQFGSFGRQAGQNVAYQARGVFSGDERARGPGDNGIPGARGRGRGFAGPNTRGYDCMRIVVFSLLTRSRNFGNFGPSTHDTNKQWTHDLHETVNNPAVSKNTYVHTPSVTAPIGPNRSFSTTTVLGNVPIQVSIPGADKRTSASMVKKHYTLLPQHRPPLRRDKPVRISIPDEHPRYIFPSTERSFIFIPRALRPNQHQFKGRGRGSFHGSRRTSMYGGSNYTPSIGMSRRPSIANSQPGSGIHTPTGPPSYHFQLNMAKPVVRMPIPGPVPYVSSTQHAEVYLGDNAAIVHSPPATLPMHQPVPQKAVSVADIESPTLKAPLQQNQQPFHQQIPPSVGDTQQKMPHIPEGAVYAQPFQPYPSVQPGFYGMQYAQHPMLMQPLDNAGYSMGMGGPVMSTVPGAPNPTPGQQGPVAHEQSGMVYYYDPMQQQIPQNYPPQMMNVNMMAPGNYFYPPFHNQQMFYQ